jgi:metal-responsive CopG/Arc/MetJ family transcriptional regulator
MDKEKMARVNISISIPEDMLKEVDDLAWKNRMDRSAFIRAALMPFLAGKKTLQHKKEKSA